MARKFQELEQKLPPESLARAKARAEEIIAASSPEKLADLARQAIEEHRAGQTEELDPERL